MSTTNAASIASDFLAAANRAGFAVQIEGTKVSVSASFMPGDKAAFSDLDMGSGCLYDLPRSGSVWGTDGGSVGGAVALDRGSFRMSASGVRKSVASAISKALVRAA